MNQSVSITPYELRNVLQFMKQSQLNILEQLSRTKQYVVDIERNWSDEQYRIFVETYINMHNSISPHIEIEYEHIIRFLESCIHMAEEYERIRMNR
jgi:hypothetical protein